MQVAGVISPGVAGIEAAAPLRADPAHGDAAWQLLDERDEWLEFSRPVPGQGDDPGAGLWESNVVFEGMHCSACAGTIEQALRATPGVLQADVSAASHRGRVLWDERAVKPSAWMRAVLQTGEFDFGWFDEIIDLLHTNGIDVDLATATASPPPWLAKAHPEILPQTIDGTILWPGARQHWRPTSPVFREHALRLVRALAERYGTLGLVVVGFFTGMKDHSVTG